MQLTGKKKTRYLRSTGVLNLLTITSFFSHPDCTVGSGISPDQPMPQKHRVADSTAGWDFHPTPKNFFFLLYIL